MDPTKPSPWSTPRKSEYGEGFMEVPIDGASLFEEETQLLVREMGDGEPSPEEPASSVSDQMVYKTGDHQMQVYSNSDPLSKEGRTSALSIVSSNLESDTILISGNNHKVKKTGPKRGQRSKSKQFRSSSRNSRGKIQDSSATTASELSNNDSTNLLSSRDEETISLSVEGQTDLKEIEAALLFEDDKSMALLNNVETDPVESESKNQESQSSRTYIIDKSSPVKKPKNVRKKGLSKGKSRSQSLGKRYLKYLYLWQF